MSTVLTLPALPLYQQGFAPTFHKPRFSHLVRAPRVPLYQGGIALGSAGQVISIAAPIAAKAGSAIATAAGIASAAGPIGAAVGVVVGLIGGLLAAHELRAKQARDENSAVNIGVAGFDSDLKSIQAALASGTDVATAIQGAQLAMSNYWALVTPHIQPGRNGCSGGGYCAPNSAQPGYCQGNIGAACCIGCADLMPSLNNPDGVLAALNGTSTASGGKTTANILTVYGSKYGTTQRSAYSITFTPGAASATASLTSALTGGSLLPLLAIGIALAVML